MTGAPIDLRQGAARSRRRPPTVPGDETTATGGSARRELHGHPEDTSPPTHRDRDWAAFTPVPQPYTGSATPIARPPDARDTTVSTRTLDNASPVLLPPWALAMLTFACLLGLAWVAGLQSRLPAVPIPSSSGAGTVLYPGTYHVIGAPVRLTGIWLQQPLGPTTWLTSSVPGSSLHFTFYGTRVTATALLGPQSGNVYVRVDGLPAPQLPRDSLGAYLSLSAVRAVPEPVTVVSGLNHGLHTLTLTNGSGGQLAIASLAVAAQSPFPWAFALADTFLFLALVTLVRGLLGTAARALGWLTSERSLTVGTARRRSR